MPPGETWQSIVDHVGLILGAIMLLRLSMLLKHGRIRNKRFVRVWLFGVCLSLFAVFELDEVYLAVDRQVGVNNLAWLLAYLCLTMAVYFLCAFCSADLPRWALPGLIATAGSLAAVFPFGPGNAPECANHFVPANVGEIVFTLLAYGYVSVMASLASFPPFIAIYHYSKHEVLTRLRTIVGMLAASTSVTFYVFRFVVFSLSLVDPSLRPFAVSAAGGVYRWLTAVAVALWIVFFGTSNRLYLSFTRLARYAHKILTLRRLSALTARIDRFVYSSVPLPRAASWLDRLRDPDLHIYRTLIAILDGRKMLAVQHKQWNAGLIAPGDPDAEEAIHLNCALQSVSDSLDFADLVNAFCRLDAHTPGISPERRGGFRKPGPAITA